MIHNHQAIQQENSRIVCEVVKLFVEYVVLIKVLYNLQILSTRYRAVSVDSVKFTDAKFIIIKELKNIPRQ